MATRKTKKKATKKKTKSRAAPSPPRLSRDSEILAASRACCLEITAQRLQVDSLKEELGEAKRNLDLSRERLQRIVQGEDDSVSEPPLFDPRIRSCAELGIPKPVVLPLHDAGLVTVGDLVQFVSTKPEDATERLVTIAANHRVTTHAAAETIEAVERFIATDELPGLIS